MDPVTAQPQFEEVASVLPTIPAYLEVKCCYVEAVYNSTFSLARCSATGEKNRASNICATAPKKFLMES